MFSTASVSSSSKSVEILSHFLEEKPNVASTMFMVWNLLISYLRLLFRMTYFFVILQRLATSLGPLFCIRSLGIWCLSLGWDRLIDNNIIMLNDEKDRFFSVGYQTGDVATSFNWVHRRCVREDKVRMTVAGLYNVGNSYCEIQMFHLS